MKLSVSIQPPAVSGQQSAFSGQRSVVRRQPSALWHRLWPLATLCERRLDFRDY
ncbi:hypothetical protein [Moorena bouillonii]|uniref:hypothetical protein n=1 Tax=Moorena bouillonii TaxID=207920 RepID=UPI001300EBC2|nr:hypothetical protein [Moorena bouillonii]